MLRYLRGNCKTHLPVKIALLSQFAFILLGQPLGLTLEGWPRRMNRGSIAVTRNLPQNHRFFRAKQFCNSLLALAFLVLQSCSTTMAKRSEYVPAYQEGRFADADAALSGMLQDTRSNDAVWLLLDRGIDRFVEGDGSGAAQDFNTCIETIDYFNQENFIDSCGKILLKDDIVPYRGDDYEQLLARVYFALVLMHQGDMSNGYALLRQAEEWCQKKREEYGAYELTQDFLVPENALGKYLFAALLEKQGDFSNSRLLYEQACEITHGLFLPPSVLNSERATVLILCHNGNAPYKVSTYTDETVASLAAFEIFMGETGNHAAISSLCAIQTPFLTYWPFSDPLATHVSINGQTRELVTVFDIDLVAQEELEKKRPVIAARSLARFAMRRAVVAAVQRNDPLAGSFCDLGMLAVNLCTQADTRSWTLLPRQIELARFDLQAGRYAVKVETDRARSYCIEVKPNDLAIIHIFNIHPGVTKVLIPPRIYKEPLCLEPF